MTHRPAVPMFAVLAVILGALPLSGQQATILVEAHVADVRFSPRSVHSLQFGAVRPGTPVTVDARTSPDAGAVEILAAVGTELQFEMELPDHLESERGTTRMSIAFGPLAHCSRGPASERTCRELTATDTIRAYVRGGDPITHGTVRIALGGTVSPETTHPPGQYGATATASLAFTAN